jgi:hypothetical protein
MSYQTSVQYMLITDFCDMNLPSEKENTYGHAYHDYYTISGTFNFFPVLYYYSTQLIEEINDCTMIRTRDLLEISKLECVNLILNHSAIRAFKSWARFSILTVSSPGPIISRAVLPPVLVWH